MSKNIIKMSGLVAPNETSEPEPIPLPEPEPIPEQVQHIPEPVNIEPKRKPERKLADSTVNKIMKQDNPGDIKVHQSLYTC
jgi:hypothetical protein